MKHPNRTIYLICRIGRPIRTVRIKSNHHNIKKTTSRNSKTHEPSKKTNIIKDINTISQKQKYLNEYPNSLWKACSIHKNNTSTYFNLRPIRKSLRLVIKTNSDELQPLFLIVAFLPASTKQFSFFHLASTYSNLVALKNTIWVMYNQKQSIWAKNWALRSVTYSFIRKRIWWA